MRSMTERKFKGFDDWIDIFSAGTHTDSEGSTKTWTEDELDELVANHNERTTAPLVVGHPETNDPAYGWVGQLKRVGKSLMMKAKDVAPTFEEAVEKGHYRKRSVSIGKGNGGLRLLHVGWLGAKPPAVDLAPMNYERPDDIETVFEFEADWRTPNTLVRTLRRLREFLIEAFDRQRADDVIPEHELEYLDDHADELRNRSLSEESEPGSSFSRSSSGNGGSTVSKFSQEDLDQAKQAGKDEAKREFEAKEEKLNNELSEVRAERYRAEFSAELEKLKNEGKLTPAQAEGVSEFMLSLTSEPQKFEFAAADGKSTTQKDRLEWFRNFLASLPKQVTVGKRTGDDGSSPRTRGTLNIRFIRSH